MLIFLNLLNLFWHTDKNFCFYAEVNFWDFVRNDNSNKGTTARLNETRFGPNKKSSPIYLGPKNIDTFWCTGWAWNCQIIFRCASIHGRAGFILIYLCIYDIFSSCLLIMVLLIRFVYTYGKSTNTNIQRPETYISITNITLNHQVRCLP